MAVHSGSLKFLHLAVLKAVVNGVTIDFYIFIFNPMEQSGSLDAEGACSEVDALKESKEDIKVFFHSFCS